MNNDELKGFLSKIKCGDMTIDEGVGYLEKNYYEDLGYAKVDHHRQERVGYPEVIFCQGKAIPHTMGIIANMLDKGSNVLATRASEELAEAVLKTYPMFNYNKLGRTLSYVSTSPPLSKTYIAIVTAGTSDIPVAEEAVETARFYGNDVKALYDVGVAGIHRLFDKAELLKNAKVLVVIAGMEGALPSVIAGMVKNPVIAVPTSVGYGANFKGLSALLGMLNSCASGLSVVNIDNGFGAAYQASLINNL